MPQNKTLGRPVSTGKVTIPNKACEILEEDVDLYTVFEFQNITPSLGNDIYTLKMTQPNIQKRYDDSMKLVTRNAKSNIILLEKVADILSEQWYNERKTNLFDKSKRAVRTAAKRLREVIKKST